jgi:hypothetical protein
MAEIKTKVSNASVLDFLNTIEPEAKRQHAFTLLKLFEKITGEKAKLWGSSIIGFGQYHYESMRSSQKGDWPLTGFSPRKANLTVYIMPGFKQYQDLLAKLGKHKTSVSCLYINKLSDIDINVLSELIKKGYNDMKKKYPIST